MNTRSTVNPVTLVNLTPHSVSIECEDNLPPLVVPPSGLVARLAPTERVLLDPLLILTTNPYREVPVTFVTYGDVIGLPEPVESTVYIVSAQVAARALRLDVLSPGTLVRDAAGVVVGCVGLAKHMQILR